jgi:hypothetical protein
MLNMVIDKTSAAIMAVALISGVAGNASQARAAAPFPPVEGTVFSTHSPATAGCPELDWHVWVGPNSSLTGMVGLEGMNDMWRLSGTFAADRSFHLTGKEISGAQRTATVDGSVRASDGSLIFTIGNISGQSACNNKSVWVPWFRNGNSYDPNGSAGGG